MAGDGTRLATALILGALILTPFCSSSGGGRYDFQEESTVEYELPPPTAFDMTKKAAEAE